MEFGERFLLRFAPSTENGLPLIWARPRFCEDNNIGWVGRDNITILSIFEFCGVKKWEGKSVAGRYK